MVDEPLRHSDMEYPNDTLRRRLALRRRQAQLSIERQRSKSCPPFPTNQHQNDGYYKYMPPMPVQQSTHNQAKYNPDEPFDITNVPKPFKNPNWKAPARRNKTLKQILQEDMKAQGTNTVTNPDGTEAKAPIGPTYSNIDAPPSTHPAKPHFCDITGVPGKYVDPKTGLRYANVEVYKAIKQLPPGAAEAYLQLRGANVVLK